MARKELISEDLPKRELPPIGDDALDDDVPNVIVAEEGDLAEKEYLDELKFNQDVLKVIIHKGREKKAPMFVPLGVNGAHHWFPVEQEIPMKRMYVEVLARSQPMDIETEVLDEQSDNPRNNIIRAMRSQYPFTVLHDPNPKGGAWLAKVMREN